MTDDVGRTSIPHAYLSSVVTVRMANETVTLCSGDRPPKNLPTPCGVITAANPAGEVHDDDTNALANVALHALLHRRNLTHVKSVSFAPDGTHVEHGWMVSGITQNELRMIGRAFGQIAVYWIDRHVDVVACR